mgnify:CR=1 FL=1
MPGRWQKRFGQGQCVGDETRQDHSKEDDPGVAHSGHAHLGHGDPGLGYPKAGRVGVKSSRVGFWDLGQRLLRGMSR